MKTLTKKKQILTKKQQEFYDFIEQKIKPFFDKNFPKFDNINPKLLQDEWYGKNILVTIPYGERMEPWLLRVINECYAYQDKAITVVMGAKVNTNAWHKYVFPFADSISFIRGGKRPTAIVTYSHGCSYKVFDSNDDNNIAYVCGVYGENLTNIDDWIAHGFSEAYFGKENEDD